AEGLDQPEALVADQEQDALEATVLEMAEEALPACLVLLRSLGNAQDVTIPVAVHTDRDQDRHVTDLAAPAALERDAVHVDVAVFLLDRSLPPLLDPGVDLLIELADRAGTDLGAPQRFGDVLDATHGGARQVHPDQPLPDGGFAPPVALDDRRLEGQLPELWNLQGHRARLGLERALVVACSRVTPRLCALIASRI